MTTPRLFQPINVGTTKLQHRLVLAPLTRFRSTKTHVPVLPLVKEYYSQRSSTPGSLLITEATFIAAKAGGYHNVPGIWNDEQINAWKEVTDQVHANGSFIFVQLWALGRAADPDILSSEGHPFVAPSPIAIASKPTPLPRELTIDEIQEYTSLYVKAAKNAVEKAGFDGVEIHGANGYIVDQFLQERSNQRSDQYGGSIQARSKFGLDVVDAVVEAIGAERTAIRLSPWSTFQDMGSDDPIPQFSYFVSTLKARHPHMAYLHLVEPRIMGSTDCVAAEHESNDFIRVIWGPAPLIVAGGYTRESAIEIAEAHEGELVAFGRYYISNASTLTPDLPRRVIKDIPFTPYDRKTFYAPVGDEDGTEHGYIDHHFYDSHAHL
ncbi:NADPH dehydrogenase 1 [Termitomyces sp. J132]|nr:NADPH dehydrogenase 1 [Termitomyces sp. J132]